MFSDMSFIYVIKSKVPNLLPCGMPAPTFHSLLFSRSTTVKCLLFDKYEVKILSTLPVIQFSSSFAIRPLCQTLSKAALTSRKIPCVMQPLVQDSLIL